MTNGKVVHVIDDDEAARESLAFLLEAAGVLVNPYDSTIVVLETRPSGDGGRIVTRRKNGRIDGIALLRAFGDAERRSSSTRRYRACRYRGSRSNLVLPSE